MHSFIQSIKQAVLLIVSDVGQEACPLTLPAPPSSLQVKIAKVLAQREQAQRKRNLTKYIPNAAAAIFTVLEKMAGTAPRGPKRRRLQEQQQLHTGAELLGQVERQEVRQSYRQSDVCDFSPDEQICWVLAIILIIS